MWLKITIIKGMEKFWGSLDFAKSAKYIHRCLMDVMSINEYRDSCTLLLYIRRQGWSMHLLSNVLMSLKKLLFLCSC